MNTPRAGSMAKACTEDSTPERTRKVPRRLRANVVIESSRVQTRSAPRRCTTASECTSAVPDNQGIRAAFSVGSQNHHPPQPSS